MSAQQDDVVAVLKKLIESRVDYQGSGPITAESDFIRDLQLDSVSRTGVLVAVEDHYDITLDTDAVLEARTVAQLATLVVARLAAK